jgi:hypothetical protein
MNKKLFLAALSASCLAQGMRNATPHTPPAIITAFFKDSKNYPQSFAALRKILNDNSTAPFDKDELPKRMAPQGTYSLCYYKNYRYIIHEKIGRLKVQKIDRREQLQGWLRDGGTRVQAFTRILENDKIGAPCYSNKVKLAAGLATVATVGLVTLVYKHRAKLFGTKKQDPQTKRNELATISPATTQTEEPAQ